MLIVFIPQGLYVSCYGFYPMFTEFLLESRAEICKMLNVQRIQLIF